jgi:hypothetical protein
MGNQVCCCRSMDHVHTYELRTSSSIDIVTGIGSLQGTWHRRGINLHAARALLEGVSVYVDEGAKEVWGLALLHGIGQA